MAKITVGFADHLKETYRAMLRDGILLVSQSRAGRPNIMTIGWGSAGIVWGKPIFIALVRPSRYTYGCIEQVPEFTVNVPTPDMKEMVKYCGTRSGRDVDKFKELGLTALKSAMVEPPLIAECAIHYPLRVSRGSFQRCAARRTGPADYYRLLPAGRLPSGLFWRNPAGLRGRRQDTQSERMKKRTEGRLCAEVDEQNGGMDPVK